MTIVKYFLIVILVVVGLAGCATSTMHDSPSAKTVEKCDSAGEKKDSDKEECRNHQRTSDPDTLD
jgi:uncharacterized protein YceK